MKTFKKIILDDLKKQGLNHIVKKIKSITYESYSGGDSVNVKAENLFKVERETLDAILRDYQDGHFDGMQDLYIHKQGAATKERTAKFVFLRNEFTTEVRAKVVETLKNEWDIQDDQSAKEKMNCWYDQAVYRLLQQLEAA